MTSSEIKEEFIKGTDICKEMHTLQAICHVLYEADVEYLFGLPGGNISKLYNYLHDYPSIKPILVRHEQVASIMAEVYGRLTRKPGVYASQGAWAVTNGTMGALEALLGSSPMLMLTDFSDNSPYSHHAPYQVGTGEYGGYDLKKSLEAVTKYTTSVNHPIQAIQSTQLAIKYSMAGNPGPVAVIFHSSAINNAIDFKSSPEIYHTKNYLLSKGKHKTLGNIENVGQSLLTAKNPYIIAGSGVNASNANKELRVLSELLGIPVGTTAGGKSALEEVHQNAVGVLGNWGQDVANKLLSEADVIIIIGSRLTPTDTIFEDENLIQTLHQKIIQIDIEERHISWTYPVNDFLIGDAKGVLKQLINYIEAESIQINTAEKDERVLAIINSKIELNYMQCEEADSDSTPIYPQRVVKEIEKVINKDTKITLDSGENRVFMTHLFKTKSANSIIAPTASGAMGYSIPSALATKLVYPDQEVIAVCGDGGFAMTMNALLTSIQYNLKIIVVVINNSSLGWVKNNQNGQPIASEYIDSDFSEIAKAMGCNGVRITNPSDINEALKKAIDSDITTVIDIITTDEESYKKAHSSLMRNR